MRSIMDASQKVPIHCWAERVDRRSLDRLKLLARWDRLAGPIAVMPDVHFADTVSVGTVLATQNCVLPTAVGEDLGCGMASRCLAVEAGTLGRADLLSILEALMRVIPAGRRVHKQPQRLPEPLQGQELSTATLNHERDWLGSRHLGTLGQGNHFVELERDTLGRLWVTAHSGSRGIGARIARHHEKVAVNRAGTREGPMPALEQGSPEAIAFLADLNWAVEFARENRALMLERVTQVLREYTGQACQVVESFDVPHNLICLESHQGQQRFVHRKGATPAEEGKMGIIPGSMGTASYVVQGLGNLASYSSCSHGAGRALSRGEAHRRIALKDFRRQMAHVVYPPGSWMEKALIEEAPSAYKDIKKVLEEQADLVAPILRLEPLAVLKGG
ncbi:MAG: RtcB family protein [Planctomycetota bacterium]|nr:RtcB family protein [Planctomycetota bacterium]